MNPRPSDYKSDALPTELPRRVPVLPPFIRCQIRNVAGPSRFFFLLELVSCCVKRSRSVRPFAFCFASQWWTGEDSNLRSPQGAADLQSAGFSHSPTRPVKIFRDTTASRSCDNSDRTAVRGTSQMRKGLVSRDTSPSAHVARNSVRNPAEYIPGTSISAGGGS